MMVNFSSGRCVDMEAGIRAPASMMTLADLFLSTLLLLFVAPAFAWAQAGQEISTACSKCHAEGRTQPATHMAHALEPAEQARILIDHPLLTATYGKFSYRIERKGEQSLYSVTDGTATITMPIRWAMGASSSLGQTYILEDGGKFYESRMSWFRELNALGPTLGGQTTHPADLNEAAGRLISQDEKLRCFGCHATDAVSGKQLTLDKMTPGVQCGNCHEATEAHVAAMAQGSGKPAVPAGLAKLRDLNADQASNFCGRCHRTWVEILMQEDHSINNLRFQPYRLWGSLCYDPDDVRISCLACHDPHTEASAQPAGYDAKCQACHGGGKVKAKACPTSKNNCVSCHMPKIELPGAHYKFSDHRIRIVKPNEPYPR
jgi:Cytochrome c554 and c-prime